jgi:hypothetical protein
LPFIHRIVNLCSPLHSLRCKRPWIVGKRHCMDGNFVLTLVVGGDADPTVPTRLLVLTPLAPQQQLTLHALLTHSPMALDGVGRCRLTGRYPC